MNMRTSILKAIVSAIPPAVNTGRGRADKDPRMLPAAPACPCLASSGGSLRRLRGHLNVHPPTLVPRGPSISICENPSIVAADALGADCGPLICVEGRPSQAAMLPLRKLSAAGCCLRYHGDFDESLLSDLRDGSGVGNG